MRGMGRVPPGIQLLRHLRDGRGIPDPSRLKAYKSMVLILTFVAYACYHASRKPPSIVKSILDPSPPPVSLPRRVDVVAGAANYTAPVTPGEQQHGAPHDGIYYYYYYPFRPWPWGSVFIRGDESPGSGAGASSPVPPLTATGRDGGGGRKGWAPFNGPGGTAKLGEIDLAFLAVYAMGMYVAGHLGDRLDLRLFLALGMVLSGVFVGLFGMGYFWGIHMFAYFLVMQMLAGLFQATGWPSVVAIVGNWFGQRKRGLIMGVWNAHTSVGNICGSLLAASVLDSGWGWSFLLPGGLMVVAGLLVYLFLAPYPEDIGLPSPHRLQPEAEGQRTKDEETGGPNAAPRGAPVNQGAADSKPKGSPVTLKEAFFIPGVIPFALCLFFSKLVAYTFLYWLPFYLSQTAIGGEYMSVKTAGNLSTLFDVGGIIGGILAGFISDQLNARATTAACFMYLAIPSLHLYRKYGGISQLTNILLMMLAGLFVNGPYALITTAVSADLGTHSSLKGDSTALATVTAIIDGTGSIGAALGPLLTGFISSSGWNMVFVMLMAGAFIAGALLSVLVSAEIRQMIQCKRKPAANDPRQQVTEGSSSEPLLRHGN